MTTFPVDIKLSYLTTSKPSLSTTTHIILQLSSQQPSQSIYPKMAPPTLDKLKPIEITGAVLSIVLFAIFIIPIVPKKMKKLYYKINNVTLDAQRRLTLSILFGLLFSVPSVLFAADQIWNNTGNAWKTFSIDILPLAAYCFVPILFAYLRPLAAVPLDLWDFLIILALAVPIIVQVILGDIEFLFDEPIHSSKLWFDFHSLYLIAGSMVIYIYSVLRPLPDTGLGREMRLPKLWDCFLTVICIGLLLGSVPLLIYTDDVFDKVAELSFLWVFVNFLCILVFLALPLELFFRGVIQNLFHARVEVFGDIRKFTSDTDTDAKLEEWDRTSKMFPETSLASYLNYNQVQNNSNGTYHNMNSNHQGTELSTMSSHHQLQQTEDLLELSLQLGAPAAQRPLAPSKEHNAKNGEYRSFGTNKNQPTTALKNNNFDEKNDKNSKFNSRQSTLHQLNRKDDKYRELLIDSANSSNHQNGSLQNSRASKDRSNSINDAYIDIDSIVKPEPLFQSKNSKKGNQLHRDSSFGAENHNDANYQNIDQIRIQNDPYYNQHANKNVSPQFGSIAERSVISTVGSAPRSVVYSTKNVASTNGVTGANIKDATSTALGTGFVSNNDAILSALNIQNDLLNVNNQAGNINNNGDYDDIDEQSLYSLPPHQQTEYYFDQQSGMYKKNPLYQNPQYLGSNTSSSTESSNRQLLLNKLMPRLDEENINFDIDLYKARQRGYAAQAFEHSPKWPTWQERHANFYNRSKLRWFLLPSKLDYLVLIAASLVYAGAMLYNVVRYIQTAQYDGTARHEIENYTWFTLFVVLAWQGFLSGFLWRMSSQIWPSVMLTAVFFTLAAYWMGIDA